MKLDKIYSCGTYRSPDCISKKNKDLPCIKGKLNSLEEAKVIIPSSKVLYRITSGDKEQKFLDEINSFIKAYNTRDARDENDNNLKSKRILNLKKEIENSRVLYILSYTENEVSKTLYKFVLHKTTCGCKE